VIADAARRFGVLRVALFGSAAQADVAVVPHDLDVSVRFDPDDGRSRAELVFGLREELERLTGMPVDLVEPEGIDNPYLLRELDDSEVVLYEAP
jgi:predicted nucleotidyltransferase